MTADNNIAADTLDPPEEAHDDPTPMQDLDRAAAKRELDELFFLAKAYRSSKEFKELLDFIVRFRFYAPYNAMLLHVQKPGATVVATARKWYAEYGRTIRPGARALVILQPMGPVMFVFDVSDTERGDDAQDLPALVEQPFGARGGNVAHILAQTIENAARDGIRLVPGETGSQSAGCIQTTSTSGKLSFLVKTRPEPKYVDVSIRYDVLITTNITSAAGKYAILVHELAHLYCGHLGSPNERFWPSRTGMPEKQREFEAESVAYMLCRRCGIEMTSHRYLSLYFDGKSPVTSQVPNISLECVLKSAGLIEQMGKRRLPPRKEKKVKARIGT